MLITEIEARKGNSGQNSKMATRYLHALRHVSKTVGQALSNFCPTMIRSLLDPLNSSFSGLKQRRRLFVAASESPSAMKINLLIR